MDRLLLEDLVSQIREKLIVEGIFISDNSDAALERVLAIALVYARIRAKNLLGVTAGWKKNFIGITAKSVDLMGTTIGWNNYDN